MKRQPCDRRAVGHWGELAAADFLKEQGFRIVTMNWSCRFGELDIVAENGRYLLFVEVKLRRDAAHGAAREFVSAAKRQKIIRTAMFWLAGHASAAQALQPRFDVIEIYGKDGVIDQLNHIPNAFTL